MKTSSAPTVAARMLTLKAADGHTFQAWEALPPDGIAPRAGIVVVQEIFGLTDYMREVCDKLASHGYRVLAPALFDRLQPELVLPYDEAGITEGLALMEKLPAEAPLHDIDACAAALRADGKDFQVGVIGFCWGGLLAWQSAQRLDIDAANCWYGGGIASHCAPPPKCPTELQFGTDDPYIPAADWEKIHKACPDVKIFIYDGAGHGFGCTARASYDRPAAHLAWERTLAFFAETLA